MFEHILCVCKRVSECLVELDSPHMFVQLRMISAYHRNLMELEILLELATSRKAEEILTALQERCTYVHPKLKSMIENYYK